jgi:drug/metabolite transporter (DMT)-like permease
MLAWFILFLLGTIWGASYLFIRVGVGFGDFTPLTFVAMRVLTAALALLVVLQIRGEKLPAFSKRAWLPLVALGILNGVIPYTLITWGETHIASGMAAILTAAMPIFTVIFAHFATHDEKFSVNRVIGIAVGFVGVVVLFLPELREQIQWSFFGQLAVVGAAVSYAMAIIVAKKYLTGVSHSVASTGQLLSASAFMAPAALIFEQPFALRPGLAAIGSVLVLALVGTSFAYILYYWLIEKTGATSTSVVTYIIPISGIALGALVLGERLDWTAFVGLALIVAGVGLVNRGAKATAEVAVVEEG